MMEEQGNMRTVCMTAITGARGRLIQDNPTVGGAEFVCYTDDGSTRSNTWKVMPAYDGYKITPEMDSYQLREANTRNAKHHKVMMHEYADCDCSLWIDSSATLRKSVAEIVDRYMGDHDIVFFPHWVRSGPGRTCAYTEAKVVVNWGIDHREVVEPQMERYRGEGYPEENGLSYGGFILRRHTEEVRRFNCLWWDEIRQHSRRDQLSLDYCLWKTGLKAGRLCEYFSEENDFVVFPQ